MSSAIRKIILCFLFCLCLWLGGLAWFVLHIPQTPVAENAKADAIVVLTGGSGRLEYGLKLLADGKAKALFISGVKEGVTADTLLRHAGVKLGKSAQSAIFLGYEAENTIGNAQETMRWLHQSGYGTILLVTANYHMPRSIVEFQRAAGDLTIIPAPVFPDNFTLSGWWSDTNSRILVLSEYHKFLAGILRHWFVFATRYV